MPLTAAGKLTIVASSNLGALGAKEGLPVICDWERPGLAPLLLPWLAMLGLLALKPNRCAAAWLIWLPFGCVIAFTQALPSILSSGTNFFLDVIAALGAGLAALWLLSNKLRGQNRFVGFLCVLLALAGFSALAWVTRQDWSSAMEALPAGIALAVGVLVSSLAFSLGGLVCRSRYRPAGLYAWLLLLLAVTWLVIAAPFFLFALMSSDGGPAWSEFFVAVLTVAAVNFATLLPFLILSSASPFFRERLKALLHIEPEAPPVIAPLTEVGLKTTQ